MSHFTALLTLLIRLARPTRGAHTTPFGYLYELGAEVRRRRSRRVRRYVEDLLPAPYLTTIEPAPKPKPKPSSPTPSVPLPRPPLDDHPYRVNLVRGPYVAWEKRQGFLQGVAG